MQIIKICGHSFAKNILNPRPMILDCGANYGAFSKWISEHCNATIHGFEPDPRLFPNLPSLPDVHFYPLAVSATGEPLRLRLGEARCSTTIFSEKPDQQATVVDSVRLDQFCRMHSILGVDMIKIDVEGAEVAILNNLPTEFLSNIGQITVEFHDFLQKDQIPDIKNVITKLKSCGFFCIKFSYHDYSDVLCINKKKHAISGFDIALIYAKKYVRGIVRITRRKLGMSQVESS